MRTEVIAVDPQRPDPAAIARAAAVLRRGGLVAFPTETVYGLGARADDAAAVARVFAAKGRPSFNPLIAHVATVEHARRLAALWPPLAGQLAARFWPGPLTLVVARGADGVCDPVTGGGPTVALRLPSHPVARALLSAVDFAVAAPSANRYQQLSPTTAAHVLKGLDGRVDLVLDGGPTACGIESTVVDVTHDPPRLLRHGSLAYDLLRMALPALTVVDAPAEESGEALLSPGMVRRHYAPRAALRRATGEALDGVVAALRREGGGVVGVLALEGTRVSSTEGALVRTLPRDAAAYAGAMFAVLHALDDAGCAHIVVEDVPTDDAWAAVRDRLARAAEAPG
ncbi:MAG: L-threonylcarbamoyladenylate synthase [Deltaproteobacteria bacterium]|nr:L-threonylcarbamoyladenylate synthase [Myxococcales bacterium]MDP3214240.1 L-threonylcarbamoyladenylate synthase [Deltaproteobacteria bacterium]